MRRPLQRFVSLQMKDEGLTFEDSLADLISRRDCVAPNRGFCDQLKILQEQCDSKLERYRPEMLQVGFHTTILGPDKCGV